MTIQSWLDRGSDDVVEADVVIVGTGPGGAAIGRVLAERGRKVVFVEEGPAKSNFRPNYAHTMRYHMQEDGAMLAFGNAIMGVAAGRGVGGGSLVNSAICWRAPDHVLNGWTDVLGGDDRFAPEHTKPVYDELAEIIGVRKTPESIAGENNLLVVRGAQAMGLEAGLLHRNAPGCIGCGVCNFGCPSGGKGSVDKNLLVMARAHGAEILADCKVDTILVEGGRAVGVRGRILHPDDRRLIASLTVRARTVIVAAGAVGTPRLLLRSGLGEALGERVGKGLHLHPGNGIMGLCDHEIRMWTGATQAAYFTDPELPGVLPHTMSLPPDALLVAMGGVGNQAKEMFRKIPYMTGCLVMVSDHGEGEVGVKDDGTADLSYWFADHDVELMREGLKRTCEVLLAGGARQLLVPIAGAGWVPSLDAAFRAIDAAELGDYQAMYAAHPMATCRMGTTIDNSVIGPTGETHGLPGLYIADSSIFPTSLGVNPQLTTMVMATLIGRNMA